MTANEKKTFLILNGWKEVPGDNGNTAWESPHTFTGTASYFDLEAAYELETEGVGSLGYAAEEALAGLLRVSDVAFMEAAEAARFAKTGVRLGVPPNY